MGGKRILVVLASICAIMVLWFLLLQTSWEKFRIAEIVRRDSEGLTQMAEEILAQGSAEGYSHPGVRRISYWDYPDYDVCLDFFCFGFGIVPSSSCKGFYYSPQDVPRGYQGSRQPLTDAGAGWSWEDDGDNRYYTEKLCDKFYFYEVHF